MSTQPKVTALASISGAFISGAIAGLLIAAIAPRVRDASYSQPRELDAVGAFMHSSPLHFVAAPLIFGAMYAISLIAIRKVLPERFRTFVVSHEKSILAVVVVCIVAFIIGAIHYEQYPLQELDRLLAPYGGRTITGRRAYRQQLSFYFRDQRPNDASLPKIVEIAKIASQQRRWGRQQPWWKSIGLNLSESDITDDGLRYLKFLPKGIGVSLSHTKVTDDGVKQLREQRPDLAIYRENEGGGDKRKQE